MRKPILPPTWFAAGLCAILVLDLVFPAVRVLRFPWTVTGIIPAAAGIALNLAADRGFKRHNTTVKPFEVSSTLVTGGVFRLSRNPMYLGMVLIQLGFALFLGAATPFLVCAAFAILLHRRFILAEEQMLAGRFAAEWREYSARVRRWI